MTRPKLFGIGAILWSLLLGAAVVVIGGSVLLPSTKRARFDFQPNNESEEPLASAASTPASTQP